jgi:hypothetical protein
MDVFLSRTRKRAMRVQGRRRTKRRGKEEKRVEGEEACLDP